MPCENCQLTNTNCGPKFSAKEFRQHQKDLDERERERMDALRFAESMGFTDLRSPRSQDVLVTVNRITKTALEVPNLTKEAVYQKIREDLGPLALQEAPLPSPHGPIPTPDMVGIYSRTSSQFPSASGMTLPSQHVTFPGQPTELMAFNPYGGVPPHTWPPAPGLFQSSSVPHLQPAPEHGGTPQIWQGWPNWSPEQGDNMVGSLKTTYI
jgi:hypothetical protein